jgi:hypothetical protein
MITVAALLFFVVGSALAIVIGCWGVDLIYENPLGWGLFIFGAGYPPGMILYERHRLEKLWISRR